MPLPEEVLDPILMRVGSLALLMLLRREITLVSAKDFRLTEKRG